MPDGKAAVPQAGLHFGRQLEQAQGIGNGHAALADFDSDILLAKLKLPDELGVALGFFERVKVFALEVFDEGQFESGAIIGLADNGRDFLPAELLGGAPAPFAGNQLKAVRPGAHDQRLNDALRFDGIGEFLERFGGEFLAWLKRARSNSVQWNALHSVAGVHGRCRRDGGRRGRRSEWRRGLRRGRRAAKQGAQAAAQSGFCHSARVSTGAGKVKRKT